MSRPGLLRRATAATLGATCRPTRATALTGAIELGLARRAAAAVIGIRSYRPHANASPRARAWEVRQPTHTTARRSVLTALPLEASPPPALRDDPRSDSSDWLTVVLAPGAPVVTGPGGTPAQQRPHRRRNTLALAGMAAVLAIAFTAFGYQLRPFVHQWSPSHSGHEDPSPTPTLSPSPSPSPSAVVNGDVPEAYLGSWNTTITNATGKNSRSLVVKQGRIGDDILILTADGPTEDGTYHCVFTASLAAVSKDGSELEFGPSAVTSGIPLSSCSPGAPSTLTLERGNTLRRFNSETHEALTYRQ
ncbi:hypothetical protein [Streptomyces sp. NPDC102487]|uniref:hypothetical protein n=1 Tax=Streptomyces sp. NPDC102487 TaxID=3366182 RepID=UPI00380001BC